MRDVNITHVALFAHASSAAVALKCQLKPLSLRSNSPGEADTS